MTDAEKEAVIMTVKAAVKTAFEPIFDKLAKWDEMKVQDDLLFANQVAALMSECGARVVPRSANSRDHVLRVHNLRYEQLSNGSGTTPEQCARDIAWNVIHSGTRCERCARLAN